MPRIVCDTDFLLKVTNEPVPKFREFIDRENFAIATIPAVVKELQGLKSSNKLLLSRKAANALSLVGTSVHLIRNSFQDKRIEADLALFEDAKLLEEDSFVATLDGNLLSRLEKNGLPYFTLRHDKPFLKSSRRATYLSPEKR